MKSLHDQQDLSECGKLGSLALRRVKPSLKAIALTGIVAVASAGSAQARPYLYSDAFDYSGTVFECMKGARQALSDAGFNDNLYKEMQDEKIGFVKGDLKNDSVTAEITCNQKLGITVMAVSGLDDNLTHKKYLTLYDATW